MSTRMVKKLKKAGEKWRPSNKTERDRFQELYCNNCAQEIPRARYCVIATLSFLLEIDHEKYPEELQIDKEGRPTCTKFVKYNSKHRDHNIYSAEISKSL